MADDLDTIHAMIDGLSKPAQDRLSVNELYQDAISHLKLKPKNDFDVEYYVRPIGLAKVIRSISRKPISRQTDMLKVLENQGFGKLSAVCGCVRISNDTYDVYHEGYVVASNPFRQPFKSSISLTKPAPRSHLGPATVWRD